MDLGKIVGQVKDFVKQVKNEVQKQQEKKTQIRAQEQVFEAEYQPEPEPPPTKPEPQEVFAAELFAQREERIDAHEFLNRLSKAGRVMHNNVEVIDVMRVRIDQINALKAYCGYSPNHDLTIQIKYARSNAQKEIHNPYVIEIG